MAKAEWGLKRLCPHCAARFYDMRRDPITCPKCGTVFDPAAQVRARRQAREEPAKPAPGPKAAPKPAVVEEEVPIGDVDEEAEVVEEEEEDEALEDASELGEDDDDVAEVLDNVDEEDDR